MKKIVLLLLGFLLTGCSQGLSALDMATHDAISTYNKENGSAEDTVIADYVDKNSDIEIEATVTDFLTAFQNFDLEEMNTCVVPDSSAASFVQKYTSVSEESLQALQSSEMSQDEKKQAEKTIETLNEFMKESARRTIESFQIEHVEYAQGKALAVVSLTGISGNAENTKKLEETVQDALEKDGTSPAGVEKAYQAGIALLQGSDLKVGTFEAGIGLVQEGSIWLIDAIQF